MKIWVLILLGITIGLGCARVRVEAPKDPIKMDISMRLDIYQHVENDIDQIENMVKGAEDKSKAKIKEPHSFLNLLVTEAYAEEGLGPEIEQAAKRRKDRYNQLSALERSGVIGENKSGLVEARSSGGAAVDDLVNTENQDRMIIYQGIAKKNGTSVNDVKKLYSQRLQADAPAGTPIEVLNEAKGVYEWKIKS